MRTVGDGIGFGQAGEAAEIRGRREKEKIDSTVDVQDTSVSSATPSGTR